MTAVATHDPGVLYKLEHSDGYDLAVSCAICGRCDVLQTTSPRRARLLLALDGWRSTKVGYVCLECETLIGKRK